MGGRDGSDFEKGWGTIWRGCGVLASLDMNDVEYESGL